MLQACIDDSGSEPQSVHFVLAGFLANVSQWERFADKWDAKLRESPSIEYLKMSEAMGLRDQFEGWDEGDRDKKVLGLAQLAHDHIEARVDCVIDRQSYNRLIRPFGVRRNKIVKDPYFLCFYNLIVDVSSLILRIGVSDIDLRFVFDKHGKIGNRARRYWDKARLEMKPDRAALLEPEPHFESDICFNPLQAADLYAWIIRDRLLPKQQSQLAHNVLHLFADKMPIQQYIGAEYLEGLKAVLDANVQRADE